MRFTRITLLLLAVFAVLPLGAQQTECDSQLNQCLADCAAFGYPNGCTRDCVWDFSICSRDGAYCPWPEYCPVALPALPLPPEPAICTA